MVLGIKNLLSFCILNNGMVMSDVAVKVENLSKLYKIGAAQQRHNTLRDALTAGVQRMFSNNRQESPGEILWALKDVSFEVKQGEVLGIIGRNGAGKSTLLKILAHITEPTSGRVALHGRVGSLLEVGTGFHPELTGRDNIYLNGAILGMKRAEIERKFDEIVAFAEIEKFLDTPVKHYSSGMYVRLAFAVAAHLEPEILVVDEVLAVGDAQFQKKCLGKMGDVAQGGRTVLFVSHNMAAVESLCSQGIMLANGKINCIGSIENVIKGYLGNLEANEDTSPIKINSSNFYTNNPFRIISLDIVGAKDEPLQYISTGDYVCFRIGYELKESIINLGFRIVVYSEHRTELFRLSTEPISGYLISPQLPGKGSIDCILPKLPFTAGIYTVDVGTVRVKREYLHTVEYAATINIQGGDVYGSGTYLTNSTGYFTCDHKWQLNVHRDANTQ